MSDVKFIYFDIGGVLFEWEVGIRNLAKFFDKPYSKVKEVFDTYDKDVCRNKISPNELFQLMKKDLNAVGQIDDFVDWWTDNFSPTIPMHNILKIVRKKYKVGILTDIYEGSFNKMLEKGLVPNLSYDVVIQSYQFGVVKPEKEFYEIAQAKAKVLPKEILLIDDNQNNVTAAKKLGWKTILLNKNNPEESMKEMKEILRLSLLRSEV